MKPFVRTLLLLACASCAGNTLIHPADREDISDRVRGRRQFLAVSMFQGPFFREADQKLLSPAPFAELRLLESPGGEPIVPGDEELVWPAGTEVRVRKVEFPTGIAVTQRPLYSPRYATWVTLEVVSVPPMPPPHVSPVWVLVLRDGIDSLDAFWREWRRSFADEPPKLLATLGREMLDAVVHKEARVGMSADVLQMAWGHPSKKVFAAPDRGVRREEWLWLGGERRALLEEGRVVQVWPPEGTAQSASTPRLSTRTQGSPRIASGD